MLELEPPPPKDRTPQKGGARLVHPPDEHEPRDTTFSEGRRGKKDFILQGQRSGNNDFREQ